MLKIGVSSFQAREGELSISLYFFHNDIGSRLLNPRKLKHRLAQEFTISAYVR